MAEQMTAASIMELAAEIFTVRDVFVENADEVKAALETHRILILAILQETLTPDQFTRVMARADSMVDAIKASPRSLDNLAIYKTVAPRKD